MSNGFIPPHGGYEELQGILRLIPIFVPRRFSAPGRRLRLHPDDYFALGTERGAIKERWFSSVITCVNCPDNKKMDVDYVLSLMDWKKNVDPHYKKTFYRPPLAAGSGKAWQEKWITYGNPYVTAKELTVQPGGSATVKDAGAFGCIVIQGHGTFGGQQAEAATMLRFGQTSADEFFVSAPAARKGVKAENHSLCEPLVILKHFPAHSEVPGV